MRSSILQVIDVVLVKSDGDEVAESSAISSLLFNEYGNRVIDRCTSDFSRILPQSFRRSDVPGLCQEKSA